jgi:type I restriction enzyme S subunit
LEELRISDLGRVVTGKTPSTKNPAFFDGDYQFVTPSDLDWRTYYCNSTERTVSEEAKHAHNGQFIPADTVMVTCIGNTIGKCAISSGPCLTNQQINSVIPYVDHDPKFVYYLLIHNAGIIRGVGIGGGSATPIVNKTTFSRIKLRVPPKSAWGSISSVLSTYDDLIENNRRRIQLLEQAARLLYKEWFVHLRFPGHEHVKIKNGVLEGWTPATIADIGEVVTGKTPSKKRESYYGDDIPFIKTPDMHGNTLVIKTEESLSEEGANTQANKTLPPRSVLVSCIGTVGAVAFNSSTAQTNQQINAIVPRNESLRYWAFFMAKDLKPLLEGMGGGATMANVNKSKFSNIKSVIPSSLMLEQFNSFVHPQIDQIEQLALMNLKLTQARDLLLPRLMNGEIAV